MTIHLYKMKVYFKSFLFQIGENYFFLFLHFILIKCKHLHLSYLKWKKILFKDRTLLLFSTLVISLLYIWTRYSAWLYDILISLPMSFLCFSPFCLLFISLSLCSSLSVKAISCSSFFNFLELVIVSYHAL